MMMYNKKEGMIKIKGYKEMYNKIFHILGDLTPLTVDCGVLCGGACCKGDENTGMLLFPYEETTLEVKITEYGERLAVCNGKCKREERPLSCRIFPFFSTIDEKRKIYIEKDYRAARLCPLLEHSEEIVFNPKFFTALKKVGKILVKDDTCREFLYKQTEAIDTYGEFFE